MEFILEKVEDWHINDNWYSLSPTRSGYYIRCAEEYLEKNIFVPIEDGSICVFAKYDERDSMRKTI